MQMQHDSSGSEHHRNVSCTTHSVSPPVQAAAAQHGGLPDPHAGSHQPTPLCPPQQGLLSPVWCCQHAGQSKLQQQWLAVTAEESSHDWGSWTP